MKLSTLTACLIGIYAWAYPLSFAEHEHEDHVHEQHGEHDHEEHDHGHEQHGEQVYEELDRDHGHGAKEAHDHEHEGEHDENSPVIVQVDAHSRDILDMRIESVPEAGRALVGSVFGYLSAPEHAVETYSLPCEGQIRLHVKSAQSVQAGDLLYTLQSPAIASALAENRKAASALARCETEVKSLQERIDKLVAIDTRNSELESQLNFKQAELIQLRRDAEAAKVILHQLTYCGKLRGETDVPLLDVYAEKAGTVRNVGISQGSWGAQGAPVITMSNPAKLEIATSLYASALPAFSEIRATLETGKESVVLQGSWRLAEQVDTEKQTRALYFTPDSLPEDARAGLLCRLDLYSNAAGSDVVSIPDSAIIKVGVDDVVFLELGAGRYAMVKVRAGESRRGMTPVHGLYPGQKLVVHGGYALKYILPAQGSRKKAGHFHADGKFHEGED